MNPNIKPARTVEDVQIKLSALWVALMLTYFLGGVLRIFAGDFTVGEIDGKAITEIMWLGIAILMAIPIAMVYLSLTCDWSRLANIILSLVLFAFNLMGLLESTNAYEFCIVIVALVVNVLIFQNARRWSLK